MDDTTTLPNDYWKLLEDLSDEMKLELISRLSNSLLHSKKHTRMRSASYFYGIWKDSESVDADELASESR